MFQLWPPSVSPVVSGLGPDVNTAPAFVSALPPQETSPVWRSISLNMLILWLLMDVEPFKAEQIFWNLFLRIDIRGWFHVLHWNRLVRALGSRGNLTLYYIVSPYQIVLKFGGRRHFIFKATPFGWGMDKSTTPPTTLPLLEFIDFFGNENKNRRNIQPQVVQHLCNLIWMLFMQHDPIMLNNRQISHSAMYVFPPRSTLWSSSSRTPTRTGFSWPA